MFVLIAIKNILPVKQLDQIIKNGINNNKSIYQIKVENADKIPQSLTTLYRYIDKGYLSTKKIDLPCGCYL